ncbi:hypothetical protein SAMN05192529_109150 [Arachidicoccus rhizosphaerae]|jgi:uncharacterized glyoxalase superfamily protein PhnB|uniref:VOC domain-containing protein n=1 Tax=Arachidicoccus rhizosphaerae TaxID=551991 RepID=A0A1H3YZB2_9BACT|nr:VOC family protein [Arachidicoccus rhizosphaerae]SEA16869.1 hypothetical protein SAMN05192529_109150 [Arachidicoccus rhizosphaerae]
MNSNDQSITPQQGQEDSSSANANPGISFITLGVKDLENMTHFYKEVLGWQMEKQQPGVRFFKMASGIVFALFGQSDLAEDIGIDDFNTLGASTFKRMTLAINFDSIIKVDAFFAVLKQKGVVIQKAPQTVFWGGYSGYFKDPEDNYWEVAYNPFL